MDLYKLGDLSACGSDGDDWLRSRIVWECEGDVTDSGVHSSGYKDSGGAITTTVAGNTGSVGFEKGTCFS